VMDRLKRDLERADVAIVLSDDRARVVDRRVPDDAVCRSLDAAMLMPGCSIERVLLGGRQPASRHAIALRSLNERIERADDVGAIQAPVGRHVVSAPAVGAWHPHRSACRRTLRGSSVSGTCSRDVHPIVSSASSSGRITRMERRTHESTAKLNKPPELHMRDTLDWDPLAGVCRGSTGRLVV
jgi:hypothetical protein